MQELINPLGKQIEVHFLFDIETGDSGNSTESFWCQGKSLRYFKKDIGQ